MCILIYILLIFIYKTNGDSNYSPDYPNVTYCILPDLFSSVRTSQDSYTYLKTVLRLDRRCTHIRGSLHIEYLRRLDDGLDPDLSFLETIVEISGMLKIRANSVKRIPLGNLKIIRGISSKAVTLSLQISHNIINDTVYLEDLDLHSLRVIMNKHVRVNNNPGLGYLVHKIDWSQILLEPSTQRVIIQDNFIQNKDKYQCHASCDGWSVGSKNRTLYCFGPREQDCQQRVKCVTSKAYTWCKFNKSAETPCDRQCVGGCVGNLPQDCLACRRVYKKNQCVSHCALEHDVDFGNNQNKDIDDRLIYTTGALCTSQCPGSLLDQDKICVYECDLQKYYKNGNRCIECPNGKCYVKIGDQYMCDLKKLDPTEVEKGRKRSLNRVTLQKLTECTIVIGELYIDDKSFESGITLSMLYDHLKNVREVIGGLTVHLLTNEVKNLTFFSNLREIRGTTSGKVIMPGLRVFVSSLQFLGLRRLEKVYGMVNFNHKSDLCFEKTIPWSEITLDGFSEPKCSKQCHPLCTRGCWGPGNTFCYKCAFKEAGDYCVKNCSDAPGYFTNQRLQCQKCHRLCKDNCTGPTERDCVSCRVAKENGACVESCSVAYYATSSGNNTDVKCMPCHSTCFVGQMIKSRNVSSACTGPTNFLGPGGCEMCNKVIKIDNTTRCHSDKCPRGFFDTKLLEHRKVMSVQKISCDPCNPLCGLCTDSSTARDSCMECQGFWSKNNCVEICPKVVENVLRVVRRGDQCPTCHKECRKTCRTENDNHTCAHCANQKLFLKSPENKFVCVANCPVTRNYTEHIDGDFVCLTYVETSEYRQKKLVLSVAIGSLGVFVIILIVIVCVFRWKSRQNQIKAELKAFYSNFNEPNMKNMNDHINRPPNKNRLQMIPIKDLIFDINSKPLGAGAFGKVYRGFWKVIGPDRRLYRLDVVVKVINNSSKASTNEFLEEAQIMASVSHRYCLPLIGVCLCLKTPCLVSVFAEYGSLEKYLHQFSAKMSSFILLKWSEQIADGMAYLNLRGIIHRDLATRNILVTSKNIVQITDFGLSRLVDDTDDGIVVQSGRVPIRWLALETLLQANYSSASDVWAYGITLWEIFTFGKRPYGDLDTSKVKTYLIEGNRLPQPEICTLDVYMIMIKCWLDDPKMRPSFTELTEIFDRFSHNSKRYLCISKEPFYGYGPAQDVEPEEISLNPMSDLADQKDQGPLTSANGIDNVTCQQTSFSNNDPDHDQDHDNVNQFINPLYYLDDKDDIEVHTDLPERIKRKRNVSFDKLKNFTKFLSTKSSDTTSSQYSPSGSFTSRKNPCVRYDSTTALIPHQITNDCTGSHIYPQIAKLLKQESWTASRPYQSPTRHERFLHSDKLFTDQNIKENSDRNGLKLLERNAGSRSPSLSSVDASRRPLIAQNLNDVDADVAENSPDSGNSHEFDLEEYLVPSRIHSLGYYNLTPSPTDTVKPTIDLSDDNIMVQNASYNKIIDDGYLEPTPNPSQ